MRLAPIPIIAINISVVKLRTGKVAAQNPVIESLIRSLRPADSREQLKLFPVLVSCDSSKVPFG